MFEDKKKLYFIIAGIVVVLIIGITFFFLNRPKPVAFVDNSPVTLNWWKISEGYDDKAFNEVITGFQKLPGNSAVTINLVKKDYDEKYYSSLIADFARGIGPDLYSFRNDELSLYKEFLSPIEIFKKDLITNYRQNFVDLAVRETMDRDKVYGITTYVDNLQMYYNKTLLNQALLTSPARDWKELTDQTLFLTRRNVNTDEFVQSTIAMGTGGRTPEDLKPNVDQSDKILPMMIFQAGGQMWDYKTNQPIFGSPKNLDDTKTNQATKTNLTAGGSRDKSFGKVDQDTPTYRAIRFYADFADPTTTRYSWNNKMKSNVDLFLEGKVAYMINFRSFEDIIKNKNSRLNYEITELPQLDSNIKRTFGQFFMDGISRRIVQDVEQNPKSLATARKYQKAQEFLEYLSRSQTQFKITSATRLPAAHREVLAEQLKGDQTSKIFAGGALYADNYYKPNIKKTEKMWLDLFESVHYQNTELPTAIGKAIQEYNLMSTEGGRK